MKIQLHKTLSDAGIPLVGVSANPDGTPRIDFAPEATDEQRAQAAQIVAAFDVEKAEHNEGVDAEIVAVEAANPITHRASREGLYAIALLADTLNATLEKLEAQIRTVPGHENFTIGRLPDLKKNAGMVRIKAADDAIRELRKKRLP